MPTPTPGEPPPTRPHVYAAIAAVTAALSRDGIAKDRRNNDQKFNFRGIDDVYNALSGLLAHNSLCIVPRVISRSETQRQTKSGSLMNVAVVEVEYDLVSAIDGTTHTARSFGEAQDLADKATNKAMSAAYKYMAFQLFCIPTQADDNDADATHVEAAPAPRQAPPPTAAAPPVDPALVQAARIACDRAGLTDAGLQAFLQPCSDLAELPIDALQRLARAGVSPQTVERCNAAGEAAAEPPARWDLPATQTQPQPATAAAS